MKTINEMILDLEENLRIARTMKNSSKDEVGMAYIAGYETAMIHAIGVIRGNHGSVEFPVVSSAASAMGKVKTKRKAASSAENGKLGGRPRKTQI